MSGITRMLVSGKTEKEALENIKDAIKSYLEVAERIITIPRANPVNAFTRGGIVKDAGLSVDEFKTQL